MVAGQTPSTTYYGCVMPYTGMLYKVQPNKAPNCGKKTQVISWNSQGAQGLPGSQGLPGEPGTDGAPGLVWRGEWQADVEYVVSDAVAYMGSSYIAIEPSQNERPGTGNSWDVLAAAGSVGPAGPTGPPTSSGGTTIVRRDAQEFSVTIEADESHSFVALCEAGETIIGGGAYPINVSGAPWILTGSGSPTQVQWWMTYWNQSEAPSTAALVMITAICASTP